MKLGFVSAILADRSLEEVFQFAEDEGFSSVELMCWPAGKAERRYAGVTHLNVDPLTPETVATLAQLKSKHRVSVSALGYYPNPLTPDVEESSRAIKHLFKLIDAAADLGINAVNSFVGRDPALSIDANWPKFLEVWRPIIAHAESRRVRVGIENCPMLFTKDEWPGGKNLATTPAIWRRMFNDIPSDYFGLNYDPSHFIWQQIDHIEPLHEFKSKLFHIHAKDARLDRKALNDHGVLSYPNLWHTPKLPVLGDVSWGPFLGALAETGYDGHVAIEVENRAFEGSLDKRKESLVISRRHLIQYMIG